MNAYALQTARKGSKSVINKNIIDINGKPLYKWNLESAKNTNLIKKVFISTDIPEIIEAEDNIILRPPDLCGDDASHYDTILHGLNEIERIENTTVDILVILLGNAMGAHSSILDASIQYMFDNPEIDSCISVIQLNQFNPYRAYKEVNGYLETHVKQEDIKGSIQTKLSNDKNAYQDSLFFNGSFWACRRSSIINNNGLLPFPWLGNKIKPILQASHIQELDSPWQLKLM